MFPFIGDLPLNLQKNNPKKTQKIDIMKPTIIAQQKK